MQSPLNVFLSVNQLAERLSVSVDTIYRWKREGIFPKAVKLSPGTTRWRLSDIEEWEVSRPTALITDIDLSDSRLFGEDEAVEEASNIQIPNEPKTS